MYLALRPAAAKDRRLFYAHRNGKCINQVVGKNQFYKVPETVANFLQLENPNSYTGHSFRRSSATLLVESGGDLMTVKKHGGWKSSNVAEGTCGSAEITPDLRSGTSTAVVSMAKKKNNFNTRKFDCCTE
ncbi:hypothetical protein NQ318_012910 [Aromia moschata]|uniref:Tyr recombinase domain-containing protein n=1 Tax=Aromia moschata TaxID=1265417 RepID=A0AAV8YFE7_9CUCU|nr:hypothetical protein NQ318_012910 [Aromia moschata]